MTNAGPISLYNVIKEKFTHILYVKYSSHPRDVYAQKKEVI